MEKHHSKLLFIIIIFIAAFFGVSILFSGKSKPPITTEAAPVILTTPNPSLTTTNVSPDGKMTLIMKQTKLKNSSTWDFNIQDQKGVNYKIYADTLPSGSYYEIPFNAFAPTNKYVFVKKIEATESAYPVLSTANSEGSEPLIPDIVKLFNQKYPDFTVTDVTGWGGYSLLVINTDKADGGIGPSFWLEAASKSFTRLSTRFN